MPAQAGITFPRLRGKVRWGSPVTGFRRCVEL